MGRLKRFYRVQIVYAEMPRLLSEIALSGVILEAIEWIDPVTVNIDVQYKQLKFIEKLLSKNGASWKSLKRAGLLWHVMSIWKRPVLVVGFMFFLALVLLVPNRIFFIEIKGCKNISPQEVQMNGEKAGIKFGITASGIRSEEVKNALLQSMPQLQWVGVTTRGSVAEIQVKERSVKQMERVVPHSVSSIVAICDGIITEQTVYEGNPLFQIGEAVKKGDILVSGYIDCGIKVVAGQSKAEIFAVTTREKQYFSPKPSVNRGAVQGKHTCRKLRVGKKVINFCNHSGIMDASCVKMYSEDYWSFPGGFSLPVSLISITHVYYDFVQPDSDFPVLNWLPQFAQEYVTGQMVSGRILHEEFLQEELDDVYILTGHYACHEMIGREKYEGILE